MRAHESKEKKDQFIELRGIKGMSLDSICQELDISKTTAINWEKQFKGTIIQTKSAHFDFLVDAYCVGLEQRLIDLKEISDSIKQEIKKEI